MNPINSGDTAFVLMSSALVMFMTPGLAFFYGGMVRAKNVLGMLMQNVFAMGLISVLWAAVGFSLAFGGTGKYIGNFDFALMKDLATIETLPGYTGDFALVIPIVAFFAFLFPPTHTAHHHGRPPPRAPRPAAAVPACAGTASR